MSGAKQAVKGLRPRACQVPNPHLFVAFRQGLAVGCPIAFPACPCGHLEACLVLRGHELVV